RDALSRFWLRARRKSRGLVILSKGPFDNAMGQNSCQPEGLQPESAMDCVARLGNRTTIAFTGRLALTNSGCNAHVFHHVRHSKVLAARRIAPWFACSP